MGRAVLLGQIRTQEVPLADGAEGAAACSLAVAQGKAGTGTWARMDRTFYQLPAHKRA